MNQYSKVNRKKKKRICENFDENRIIWFFFLRVSLLPPYPFPAPLQSPFSSSKYSSLWKKKRYSQKYSQKKCLLLSAEEKKKWRNINTWMGYGVNGWLMVKKTRFGWKQLQIRENFLTFPFSIFSLFFFPSIFLSTDNRGKIPHRSP